VQSKRAGIGLTIALLEAAGAAMRENLLFMVLVPLLEMASVCLLAHVVVVGGAYRSAVIDNMHWRDFLAAKALDLLPALHACWTYFSMRGLVLISTANCVGKWYFGPASGTGSGSSGTAAGGAPGTPAPAAPASSSVFARSADAMLAAVTKQLGSAILGGLIMLPSVILAAVASKLEDVKNKVDKWADSPMGLMQKLPCMVVAGCLKVGDLPSASSACLY
jgi:hypothetical protein